VGPALDAVIQGSKDGGATLKEFADNAGPLLNVARALNIPLNDLIATLSVMVNATGNAQQSISDLTRIITRLDTAEARAKLRDLGIEGTNLIGIFRQIADRGLGLDQILELGVASTKSAAGISALTNNAKGLPDELKKVGDSAGLAKKNLEALYDTPRERSARFDAAIEDARINLGKLAGSGSLLQSVATDLVDATFNAIPRGLDRMSQASKVASNSTLDIVKSFFLLKPAGVEAAAATAAVGAAASDTADKNDRLAASVNRASATLRDFSKRLLEDVQALQAASARDIADAQARADAQIAALDRSAKAQAATAAETLRIQTKLAADRLAIIQREEAAVTAAVEKAIAAREAIARKAGESEQRIAAESAQARIQALAPIVAQYQALYATLIGQAQQYAGRLQSIENERLEFNKGIERQLFDIRLATLSVFDQYVAKVREAERLISEARKAGVEGDIANAKKYTDEAIALALSLRPVLNENGVQIVTALQNQTQVQTLLKQAAEGYNSALDQQADAATEGFKATQAGIAEVLPKITELQQRYDAIKASIDEGLQVRVALDAASVSEALATLEEIARPRETTVTVRIKRVEADAAGGLVGFKVPPSVVAQAFAGGGPVFPRPNWSKVPGAGNADTVPAALQAGSFVVRKTASAYYGDATMARLARGFAGGGQVRPGDKRSGDPKSPDYDPRLDPNSAGFDPSSPDLINFYGSENSAFREAGDFAGPPDLPDNPRELERKVLAYLDEVIRAARQNEPNLWGRVIAQAAREQRNYENRPTRQNLLILLARARGIGLNLRSSTGEFIGFDIDGRRFH
jgi:hypothetical protein